MSRFFIGVIVGVAFLGTLTYIFPRRIAAVNTELVKSGMAYYHPKTKECVWLNNKEQR